MKTFQEFISQEPLFLELFENEEQVFNEFAVEESKASEYKILFAYYNCESYEGDAIVFAVKDGELYEISGGHCSCYGLEGQFDPEHIPAEAFDNYFKTRGWYMFENTKYEKVFKEFCGL